MEKLWQVWKYVKTMEPTRHSKTCLSLTSLALTVVSELQEKWMSFAIMLHAYLIQDKDEGLVKDRISDIEDRIVEINESERKKEK